MTRKGIAGGLVVLIAASFAGTAAPGVVAQAATPVVTVPRGVMPIPSRVHPRNTASSPAPHLTYYGGHVMSAVRVYEVLYGSGTYEPEVTATASPNISGFYTGVTNSRYLDWLSEYNTSIKDAAGQPGSGQAIGRGSFGGMIPITPSPANDPSSPGNAATISDAQIQSELSLQVAAGVLPTPTANTLYAIYFPAGVTVTMPGPNGTTQHSGVDFCAYHSTTPATPSGSEMYYSVLPDFTTGGMVACGNTSDTEFQRVSMVSSHELMEAITDPEVGNATNFAPPLGWYDRGNNMEAADLCESAANAEATMVGGDGHTYTVQRIWSNAQTACVDAPGFTPRGVGAPSVTVGSDGTQVVFWKGSDNNLNEAYYTSAWNGPIDYGSFGPMVSAPSAAYTRDGSNVQVVFWEGSGGHLMEAWYSGGWNGPVDWTASAFGGRGLMASAPAVATLSTGTQVVFWRGTDGHLVEAWYSGGWNGPVDESGFGLLASAPAVSATATGSTQVVFWQGTDNHLTEAWYTTGWNGPVDWTGLGTLGSAPTVAITATDGSSQSVFFRAPDGHLVEDWYSGGWNGPVDWTAGRFGGAGLLSSAPSLALTPGGASQLLFWQGAGSSLWEAWFSGNWNGPVNYSS